MNLQFFGEPARLYFQNANYWVVASPEAINTVQECKKNRYHLQYFNLLFEFSLMFFSPQTSLACWASSWDNICWLNCKIL